MRDPLEKYYPGVNFWNVVPQLADVAPFRPVFDGDPSPDKLQSSAILWWVVRVYHLTHRNVLREMMEAERMADVSEALFGDAKWHTKPKRRVDQLEELRIGWEKLKPQELKSLETMRLHFQQRDEWLKTLKYTNALDVPVLNRENGNTPKLIAQLADLEMAYRVAMGELDEEEDEDEHALEGGWFNK